jgi:glycosyltransferase involved in cell wall biosynthesis
MRILILSDSGVLGGGSERINVELRAGLRARGHDARIFASRAGIAPPALPFIADYSCFGTTGWSRRILPMVNPSAGVSLRRVLREFKPDVVHVRMFLAQLSPLILPVIQGIPAVLHLGSYHLVCPTATRILPDGSDCTHRPGIACYQERCVGPGGLLRITIQTRAWARWRSGFGLVVANSQAMARELEVAGLEVDQVIVNGTAPVPPRPPLTGSPLAACAGRLLATKGVDDLLDAFPQVLQEVPDARLLIVGRGPHRSHLAERIARSGMASLVELRDHVARPRLDDILGDAWVQVLPSRFREPSSNVLPEAMMRGTAVVATATGGTPEIVRDGKTGYLVPAGRPDELAKKLALLLRDRPLAERMGSEGRRIALEEYTTDRMVEQFEAAYRMLLAR